MSILYVLMILYQCVGHEYTMGMICMLMLIIGCVEMAGVHDWGVISTIVDIPVMIVILIFRGVIDEDIDSRDHRWCHVCSVHTDTRYDHICSSLTSF